jgi:excisionase family DNA binding protein
MRDLSIGGERTISVGAAARITGLHPATVRSALLRGDLEGYRAGTRGMFRIPRRALETWIRPAHNPEEANDDADR